MMEEKEKLSQMAAVEVRGQIKQGKVLDYSFSFKGKPVRVVGFESDNPYAASFARWYKGLKADVVVIEKSSGNIFIGVSAKSPVELDEAVVIVRLREQERRGMVKTTGWNNLRASGTVAGAENWYYYKETKSLMNGSLTHPFMAPTRLSLKEVFFFVVKGVDQKAFFKESKDSCSKGLCSLKKKCPLFRFGLDRCRKNRQRLNQGRGGQIQEKAAA